MTRPLFVCTDKSQVKKVLDYGGNDFLISYWFIRKNTKAILEYIYNEKCSHSNSGIFMLDSGAFSAWKNGSEIRLYDYIDFIKNYHQYFTHIVCLDVIDNPLYSEVNHLIMLDELKDYNLTIIPVFHSGEPFSVLDYMVEKGYKYLGISPNNNWREETKRAWLHRVYARHDFENLGIKTHGFGYQSISGLLQFPMTTADATTWLVGQKFGEIIDLDVSSVNSRIKYSIRDGLTENHIDNICGGHSDFVKELCAELGFAPDEMKNNYHNRNKFNVLATIRLLQRNKIEVSLPVDLLSEDKGAFGYCDDFSEDKTIEIYNFVKSLGREYTGSPLLNKDNKQHLKLKRVQKKDIELLF